MPAAAGAEDKPVIAPVHQIGAGGVEDVPKGGVASVTRTVQHRILAVDLAGKQHAVAVGGREWVLHLPERLEILRRGQSDARPLRAGVAPCDVEGIADSRDARVIAVVGHRHVSIPARHLDRMRRDVPPEAIPTRAHVEAVAHVEFVHSEDPGIAAAESHDGAVVNAVGAGDRLRGDDGIAGIPFEDRFVRHLSRSILRGSPIPVKGQLV